MANILCVDDDPVAVSLKRQILENAGHRVATCTSVDAAVAELRRSHYDAIVTDWRLGEGSGRSIVKAAKLTSSVPVIVVSGYISEAFQAAEPLADLYLAKPVNPEELLKVIHTLLSEKLIIVSGLLDKAT